MSPSSPNPVARVSQASFAAQGMIEVEAVLHFNCRPPRFRRLSLSFSSPPLAATMLLKLAVWLAAMAATAVALSQADIDAVFPSSASLTGQTIPLGPFVFTLVLNSTHALYALNATSTAPSSVGWMSVGQGSRMSNADYIIAWPSVSSSAVNWTLSHRLPSGGDSHSVPSLASSSSSRSTADFYTLVPALTTTQTSASYASVAWIRERTPPSTYPTTGSVSSSTLEQSKTSFIYGAASKNPKTTNEGTTSLAQHNLVRQSSPRLLQAQLADLHLAQGYGTTSLDLAATFNATVSQQIASGNGPVTSRTVVLAAHAVAGALAFAFISPAAVFIARLGRDWFAWYRPHLILGRASRVAPTRDARPRRRDLRTRRVRYNRRFLPGRPPAPRHDRLRSRARPRRARLARTPQAPSPTYRRPTLPPPSHRHARHPPPLLSLAPPRPHLRRHPHPRPRLGANLERVGSRMGRNERCEGHPARRQSRLLGRTRHLARALRGRVGTGHRDGSQEGRTQGCCLAGREQVDQRVGQSDSDAAGRPAGRVWACQDGSRRDLDAAEAAQLAIDTLHRGLLLPVDPAVFTISLLVLLLVM
ncbi:hypothetical protein AAT19DRAFT_15747 [Rhodotorula toruloides]|uniref:DOMON domain-containing protein n=1 Tax=Rhodotorula toruloides TaxID=5286 RepID=A0A2T0A4P8_RHOTO|nr:hypothetical protein AAT19DRAFT_15747 [Rhodotorula toruloides]